MDKDDTFGSRKRKFLEEKEHHRSEFIVGVIVTIIIWYILNNLLNWHLSFISPTFSDVLGIFNLYLITTIIINFILIFYHPGWFRNPVQIIPDVLGMMTAYTLLVVFPFILGMGLAIALKILLLLIIVGTFIGVVIHVAKFVYIVFNR